MSKNEKKRKVIYSKVPQFQEEGDGADLFEEDVAHDEGIYQIYVAVGKPRTGREKVSHNHQNNLASTEPEVPQ